MLIVDYANRCLRWRRQQSCSLACCKTVGCKMNELFQPGTCAEKLYWMQASEAVTITRSEWITRPSLLHGYGLDILSALKAHPILHLSHSPTWEVISSPTSMYLMHTALRAKADSLKTKHMTLAIRCLCVKILWVSLQKQVVPKAQDLFTDIEINIRLML